MIVRENLCTDGGLTGALVTYRQSDGIAAEMEVDVYVQCSQSEGQVATCPCSMLSVR